MNPKKMTRNLPYYAEQCKRKMQYDYEGAWLFGQYVLQAVATALGGSNKNPYPEKPIDLYEEEMTDEKVMVISASERFRAGLLEDNLRRYGVASLDATKMKDVQNGTEVN